VVHAEALPLLSLPRGREGVCLRGLQGLRLQRELLSKATISLDLKGAEAKPAVLHRGWISVGKGKAAAA
jgi:hypothetical protein